MSLYSLLKEQKSAVVKKWFLQVIATYPADGQRFLKKEKDRFSNPVGRTLSRDIENLYDALISDDDGQRAETVARSLDEIIRIRAVQDLSPSQAVGFVLGLRPLIRSAVEQAGRGETYAREMELLEERIDDAALTAFDIYSKCRKTLYDIRVKEVQTQVGRLLQRAGLVCEIPELEGDLPNG